jgi:hypothetical protein
MLGINPQDGKAIYELQLELHNQAEGKRPIISANELLDLHLQLAQLTSLKSLVQRKA